MENLESQNSEYVTQNNKNWFALYTKPRNEFKAQKELEELQIENYLPTITRISQWSDRKKKITEPVLRGYIFIHATEKERLNALEQKSIIRTLSFKGRPAAIPAWQIENLRRFLQTKADFQVSEYLPVGSKVKILEGPFENVIGIVKQTPNGAELSVSVDILNRSLTVILTDKSIYEPVKDDEESTDN